MCYTTEKVNNSLSVERVMNYSYIESNYSILFQASVFSSSNFTMPSLFYCTGLCLYATKLHCFTALRRIRPFRPTTPANFKLLGLIWKAVFLCYTEESTWPTQQVFCRILSSYRASEVHLFALPRTKCELIPFVCLSCLLELWEDISFY